MLIAVVYGAMAAVLSPQFIIYAATPILIMVAIILWMMPDTGGISTNKLQSYMLPYLFLAIAWPNYIAFNIPGLPWISLTRGALLIVMVIFVWNISTSSEMRDKVGDTLSVMPFAARVFWIFSFTLAFSLVFSDNIGISVKHFINIQIYWTIPLLVSAILASRPGFVDKFVKTLIISTSIVIIYSLYEYFNKQPIWLNYLPSFLEIDPEVIGKLTSTQARFGTDIYRVRGPYFAALYFSEFLTMTFPFFLHFLSTERRALQFFAFAAAVIGCFFVMVLTDARTAMIGFLVALVLHFFYNALRQRIQNTRSIVGTAIVFFYPIIVVTLSLIVWFWNRAHVMVLGGGQHTSSSEARIAQWAMAWPKIFSHPFGHGTGQGNAALGYFNPGGEGTVDSYFITIMMDSGYLALPLFLLTFFIPAWHAFNNHRTSINSEEQLLAPLSIAIINFLIVKSVLSSEAGIPLAFMFVGCIFGLLWQRQQRNLVAEPAAVDPPLPQPVRRPKVRKRAIALSRTYAAIQARRPFRKR